MIPENKEDAQGVSSCFKPGTKKLVLIGITSIVFITIFSMAMFKPRQNMERQVDARSSLNTRGQTFSQQAPHATQSVSPVTCPFCGFYASNPIITPNGMLTCPNCARNIIPPSPSGGAFTQAVFTPGRNVYPNYAQGFTQGQQVAFTKPGAPPITRDAVMPHPFRGVCSNCHQILETPAGIGARW